MGHSASCSDPYKLLVQQLDLRKAKLAVDADVLASTALDKLSRVLGEGEFRSETPMEYVVMNFYMKMCHQCSICIQTFGKREVLSAEDALSLM